jgi:type IV secretory pathway TrbD component
MDGGIISEENKKTLRSLPVKKSLKRDMLLVLGGERRMALSAYTLGCGMASTISTT